MFTKFIDWIKNSFNDKFGQASSKRLTAFWFILIITFGNIIYITQWGETFSNNFNVWIVIHLLFSLLMFGLINIDQILSGLAMLFNRNKPKDDQNNGTV